MKNMVLVIFFVLAITVMPSYADDDEYERIGIEDREYDDEYDERAELGTGIPDIVLYATISVILITIGYTGFRIINIKRPKLA